MTTATVIAIEFAIIGIFVSIPYWVVRIRARNQRSRLLHKETIIAAQGSALVAIALLMIAACIYGSQFLF